MPAGLQVFDASGAIVLDTTMRVARLLGQIITPVGVTSGASSDPDLATGTPFYFAQPLGATSTAPVGVSFSGNTLNWTINPGGNPSASYPQCLILYGVF